MPPIKVSELADADWELLEIELDGRCPCSEVLDAAPVDQSALVDRKLRILAAAGVPPASKHQVEFLHAVPKKGWKRDPEDIELCYRLLDRIDQGTADCRSFHRGP